MGDPTGLQVTHAALAELLAPALGDVKAKDVIQAAAEQLHLEHGPLTRDQALALLDHIALGPGLVGISARFVKSRLILRWFT
ncbi:MAG: hypothetical protein R3B13_10565 [Polyangiaceae bacterium]